MNVYGKGRQLLDQSPGRIWRVSSESDDAVFEEYQFSGDTLSHFAAQDRQTLRQEPEQFVRSMLEAIGYPHPINGVVFPSGEESFIRCGGSAADGGHPEPAVAGHVKSGSDKSIVIVM
jgi:hypothetical protein